MFLYFIPPILLYIGQISFKRSNAYYCFCVLYIVFFLCFGYMCGSDWRNYEMYYEGIDSTNLILYLLRMEPGYVLLMYLSKILGIGFWEFAIFFKCVLCIVSTVGTIEEIDGKNAIVTFGMMRTNVKPERLERAAAPDPPARNQAATFVSKQTQDSVYEKKLNFKQDIDVRGMRGDEAIHAVTYFIDDAILLGISRVRILHGTGSGILRTLIRQYLHTVPGVKDFKDEHVQFGGAGITVVDLA